jgi:hypothetical protein
VALMDGAMVDGLCRLTRKTFHQALRQDLFGMGESFTKWVPETPMASLGFRHTVGLADPIFTKDIEKPLRDGLPESLEQVVEQYRARYYKVKISGDTQASLARMGQIAQVLDQKAGDYKVTLDGNEQFATMDAFLEFVKIAAQEKSLAPFWSRILWVEQPVERSAALDPKVAAALAEINKYKPVIVDESDGDDQTVELALSLGYRGISAKNCKGVFRTLHSYRYLKETGDASLILSSEDLTNVPIYPLQQDCCVAAALGITHTERNGHHYIRGFQFLSAAERDSAEREFPSLYRPGPDGISVLRIENGNISMLDINRYGYGTRSLPDWNSLKPVLLPDRREPL